MCGHEDANKAIERERHPSSTVDDLVHNLNGATVFSKLDLKAGYHQIPLAEESHHVMAFVTHQILKFSDVNLILYKSKYKFNKSSLSFPDLLSQKMVFP